jgi:hypothetical protein
VVAASAFAKKQAFCTVRIYIGIKNLKTAIGTSPVMLGKLHQF